MIHLWHHTITSLGIASQHCRSCNNILLINHFEYRKSFFSAAKLRVRCQKCSSNNSCIPVVCLDHLSLNLERYAGHCCCHNCRVGEIIQSNTIFSHSEILASTSQRITELNHFWNLLTEFQAMNNHQSQHLKLIRGNNAPSLHWDNTWQTADGRDKVMLSQTHSTPHHEQKPCDEPSPSQSYSALPPPRKYFLIPSSVAPGLVKATSEE